MYFKSFKKLDTQMVAVIILTFEQYDYFRRVIANSDNS